MYLRAAGVAHVRRDEAAASPGVRITGGVVDAVQLCIAADDEGRFGVVRAGDPASGTGASPLPLPPIRPDVVPTPIERALGALLADAACRVLVTGTGKEEPPGIVLGADGRIASRSSSAVLP